MELGVPPTRIVIQRNGVDGQRFFIRDKNEARRLLGLSQDQPIACFVGNMVEEKGPDVLVDAIHGRSDALRELNVIFVGDGELTDKLKQRVAQLGLSAKVRFLGRQAPDTIPLWISAADMLCLPSRREGCPNVVLEALAAGRPVIASKVGGVPELLNDQNGIMVPAGDPVALAIGLAEGLHRSWNSAELRGSVPALSWDASGRTFYESLVTAVGGAAEAKRSSRNFDIHTGSCV
jgi:glycosyltransferase involved in cell wall biosynthesis